jgi:hypothetical protein
MVKSCQNLLSIYSNNLSAIFGLFSLFLGFDNPILPFKKTCTNRIESWEIYISLRILVRIEVLESTSVNLLNIISFYQSLLHQISLRRMDGESIRSHCFFLCLLFTFSYLAIIMDYFYLFTIYYWFLLKVFLHEILKDDWITRIILFLN